MPINTIKVIVESPKNSWLDYAGIIVAAFLVIIGWFVSYFAEKKKLKIEIEVKAAEEAINLLNEKSNEYTDICAPLVSLYRGFKYGKLKNNKTTEELYLEILIVYETALDFLLSDKFSAYCESREIIFFNFRDKIKQLHHFRLNISDMCFKLNEDLTHKYFPRDKRVPELNQQDIQELVNRLQCVIKYFAELFHLIFNLKVDLQNEFLKTFYNREREIPGIPLKDVYRMYGLPKEDDEAK